MVKPRSFQDDPRFEYLVDDDVSLLLLNEYGSLGWALVAISTWQHLDGTCKRRFYFQRDFRDPPSE